MRGLVAAALTVVAAFSLVPAGRAALVIRDDVDAADVTFTADPGEANRVVVREEPGGFRFVDAGSVLRTSTCTPVSAHEVFCPGIAETLIVEVGDGDDSVDVSGAAIALVDGGDGADVLVAAFAAGGAGADVLRGIDVGGRLRGGRATTRSSAGPGTKSWRSTAAGTGSTAAPATTRTSSTPVRAALRGRSRTPAATPATRSRSRARARGCSASAAASESGGVATRSRTAP